MEAALIPEKNIARWALFEPEAAKTLQSQYSALMNVHVPPPADDMSPLGSLQLDKLQVIYYYGVGQGESFCALEAWLADENHCLVFLESDLGTVGALLKTPLGQVLIYHPRVWLFF